MVTDIAAVAVVHDEVEVLSVLEGAKHINQKRMGHFLQKLLFIHNRMHRAL